MAETFLTRKIDLPPLNFSTEQIVFSLCTNGPNRYKASKPKFVFLLWKEGWNHDTNTRPFSRDGYFLFLMVLR
jgi:hypothetical protein